MVIIPGFQPGDEGPIPFTRFNKNKIKNHHSYLYNSNKGGGKMKSLINKAKNKVKNTAKKQVEKEVKKVVNEQISKLFKKL